MNVYIMMMIMLLTPLVIFGLFFLSWLGIDQWESWKEGRKMKRKHLHHLVLGLWPLFCAYIGIRFAEKIPFLPGLIFVILTAALYFFSSVWDVRYESIHQYTPRESLYWSYRIGTSYPLLIVSLSGIAMFVGIGLLIITLLNLSGEGRSLVAFLTFGCVYLMLYLFFYKQIPSWKKRAGN